MKTTKEFAELLNGREYKKEITEDEIAEAASSGLVIIYGKSDDTTMIHGAIEGECATANGGDIYLTEDGIFEDCPCHCVHSERAKAAAKAVHVNWCKGPFVWSYVTEIPHVHFEIEDNQPAEILKFCQGIVFEKKELSK